VRDNSDHIRGIIEALETESTLTQRALALRLGIALGSINQLLRQLITRGWIRGVRAGGPHIRYVVTAGGREGLARMTRENLRRALVSYNTVHERIRHAIEACQSSLHDSNRDGTASLAMYGTGQVAQIAFACAADVGVTLVGFVDDEPRSSFLGLPVRSPGEVRCMVLAGRSFDWLLVASFEESEGIRRRLEALQFPLERVSWL
jgi:DNA-binding MarR family transcriptional regulator